MRCIHHLHRYGSQHGSISSGRRCQGKTFRSSECRDHDSPASWGAQGQATEIEIAAKHILRTKEKLNSILSERTGQPMDVIVRDTDRDNYMTAEEAKAYGLIDQVIAGH